MKYRAGSLLPRWHWNVIADTAILLVVWVAVLVASNITEPIYRSTIASWGLVLFAVATTALGYWVRSLYEAPRLARTDEISKLISTTIAGSCLTAVAASFTDTELGAAELLIATPVAIGGIILARGILTRMHGPSDNQRVVIVGTGAEALELVNLLETHPESALTLVGVVGDGGVADRHGLSDRWLGPANRVIELMGSHGATGAVITPTGFRGEQYREITTSLFEANFDIHLSTGVNHIYAGRFEVRPVVHEPLVRLTNHSPLGIERKLKRALDIVGAASILLLTSPLLAVTAIAIKLEDDGPILFRQQRTATRDHRGRLQTFEMLKFRSMGLDAEQRRGELAAGNERSGPIFKLSADPRITRVGRIIRELSVDELPQLINVLRGEMSLVGPRPALLEEEIMFDEEHRRRFDVQPGITGLWQVEARSNAQFGAYKRLDLHYVENWNLALDLKILVATFAYVTNELLLFPFQRIMRTRVDGVNGPTPIAPPVLQPAKVFDVDAVDAASKRLLKGPVIRQAPPATDRERSAVPRIIAAPKLKDSAATTGTGI